MQFYAKLHADLTTENAFNLNESIEIFKDEKNGEYIDNECCIDSYSILKTELESILDAYCVEKPDFFTVYHEHEIMAAFDSFIADFDHINFKISLKISNDEKTLFNLLFCDSIQMIEDSPDFTFGEYWYESFDLAITDIIESCMNEENSHPFQVHHTLGENINGFELFDIYYKFEDSYIPSSEESADPWSIWVGNQSITEFLTISRVKNARLTVDRIVDDYLDDIPEIFPEIDKIIWRLGQREFVQMRLTRLLNDYLHLS
jgi:hypothetical protein